MIVDAWIEDPVSRYRVRLSRDDPVLRGEVWVDPGGGVRVEHYHPSIEERTHMLEGEITHWSDGHEHVAGPGSEFTIAPGVRHSFANTGRGTAHYLVEMEPALQMDEVLRELARLGREGKWTAIGRHAIPTGPWSLFEMAEFLERYQDTIVPSSPPRLLRRIAVPPLARLARWRRHRRQL